MIQLRWLGVHHWMRLQVGIDVIDVRNGSHAGKLLLTVTGTIDKRNLLITVRVRYSSLLLLASSLLYGVHRRLL